MNNLKLDVLKKIMEEMDNGVSENSLKPKAAIIKEKMMIIPKKGMAAMEESPEHEAGESPDFEKGEDQEMSEMLAGKMGEEGPEHEALESPEMEAGEEEEMAEHPEISKDMARQLTKDHIAAGKMPEEDLGFSSSALRDLLMKKKLGKV